MGCRTSYESKKVSCDSKKVSCESKKVCPPSRGIVSHDKIGAVKSGRLQYFFHSPSSKLPIRDVRNEQRQGFKTEPHIEIGAENYWNCCYQSNNIIPMINNNEGYLFLMTTCRNWALGNLYGLKLIVGYIKVKQHWLVKNPDRGERHYFVKGPVFLYHFKDSIPITRISYSKWTRTMLVSAEDTETILAHFKNKKNILKDCVREIRRLDQDNLTCLRKLQNANCAFSKDCLRWAL